MLHKQSSETDPADWFYTAEERLRGADLLWRHEGITLGGIEFLQESAERYLKGYLVAKGWRLLRTHDLRTLLSDALVYEPKFAAFKSFASDLTAEFFEGHYPGGDWTGIGHDYEALRRQAGELIDLIKVSLPQHFPPPPPPASASES